MERITPVNPQAAQGRAKELLDAVRAKLSIVPNMTRSMAVSPSVLEASVDSIIVLRANSILSHVRTERSAVTWSHTPNISSARCCSQRSIARKGS